MRGLLVSVNDLPQDAKQQMYGLVADSFDKPSEQQFEYDLIRKDWVVLVEDDRSHVCGFTSLKVWDQPHDSETVLAIYSGDTILARDAWNTPLMWKTWAAGVNQLRKMRNQKKIYWFFVTCAYRSYRFLPVLTNVFYPRCDVPTPPRFHTLLDRVGTKLFGSAYEPRHGVVALSPTERLRDDLLEIPPARMEDPHVAFFHRRNPNRHRGAALLCVAELSPNNLTPAGRRILTRSIECRPVEMRVKASPALAPEQATG